MRQKKTRWLLTRLREEQQQRVAWRFAKGQAATLLWLEENYRAYHDADYYTTWTCAQGRCGKMLAAL